PSRSSPSDWTLGYDRFVRPVRHRDLLVMVPYHVGQALLIVGLAIG
ncbi:MAG: lysoplasmalogenase family protein, partial [Ilumatobacteraceae bacterium]